MASPTQSSSKLQRAESALAACAESFPQVTESRPWGHRAFKVNKKTFLFLYASGGELSLSVKLPRSRAKALDHDFAKPTEYGLGRSGWITAAFQVQHELPIELLKEWIGESFEAIAPKRLLAAAALSGGARKAPTKHAATTKTATAKAAITKAAITKAAITNAVSKPAAKKRRASTKSKAAKKTRS